MFVSSFREMHVWVSLACWLASTLVLVTCAENVMIDRAMQRGHATDSVGEITTAVSSTHANQSLGSQQLL